MPVNYQNSKIYKIEQINGEGLCYVGSTTKQYLSQRLDMHRGKYKGWKNGTAKYVDSFQIFDDYGVENCQILLLESFLCNSKDELKAKIAEYTKNLDCVNKIINKTKRISNKKEKIIEDNPIIEETIKVRKTDDPEYFKNYYHISGLKDKIPCELCKRLVSKQKMKRHQEKSNLCKKVLDVFNLD
jgi:phosphopantothenoylcysteine synthetase/decarboxylase